MYIYTCIPTYVCIHILRVVWKRFKLLGFRMIDRYWARKYFECLGSQHHRWKLQMTVREMQNAKKLLVSVHFPVQSVHSSIHVSTDSIPVSTGLGAGDRACLVAFPLQNLVPESYWRQLLKEDVQDNVSVTIMEFHVQKRNIFCPSHRVLCLLYLINNGLLSANSSMLTLCCEVSPLKEGVTQDFTWGLN